MSPNEFQLRAALRDGEGDVPDVDVLIAGAVRVRQERRRRITTLASAAAVVAVIVAGGTLLATNRTTEDASSVDAAGGAAAPRDGFAVNSDSIAGALTHGGNPSPFSSSATTGSRADDKAFAIECPGTLPKLTLPGGGDSNQRADEPLFPAPVAGIKVCAYGAASATTALSGSVAARVASELNDAGGSDPRYCVSVRPKYALYAVSESGALLPVVTATPGCTAYEVTNGTAERTVPFDRFEPLRIAADGSPVPNRGSPIK